MPADVGTVRGWGGPTGAVGTRTVELDPTKYDDNTLFFSISGHAAAVIVDLQVGEVRAAR